MIKHRLGRRKPVRRPGADARPAVQDVAEVEPVKSEPVKAAADGDEVTR